MAQGDVVAFARFKLDFGTKVHQLATDVFKLGIITNSVTPTATTTDPRWGAGGTTNFSSNQVTPGGNYTTGGPTLTSNTYTLASATTTFDADNISVLQNASNPTNARWGIGYNNTSSGKECVYFVDLGSVFDMSTGDLTITWSASGIFTLT
jgi:hypothetical protein